ncbi:response regulator [Paenibacillus flagellatus]|uniref:response regulator n=1 Tax=Paenibacillus flagellatus TaxID=2211139 RepID=UPI001305197F|nr:response regulator [Paenibacillus flagellatus]
MKLLLVDDEPLIRQNLSSAIDWRKHGIEIVGEAGDGIEALAKIEELRPDMVILDVHMPRMNGIQVAETIIDRPYKPNILFLSGIKEFEYARKALLFDAECYLLKPIRSEELDEMVEKVKNKIWREQYREEIGNRMKKQIAEHFDALREQFLNQVIRTSIHADVLDEKSAFFGIDLCSDAYALVLIDVEQLQEAGRPEEERQMLKYTVCDLARKVIGDDPDAILYVTYEEQLALLVTGDRTDRGAISDTCTRIMNALSDVLDVRVTIGVSRRTNEIARLPDCFKEAREALRHRFFQDGSCMLHISDVQVKREGAPDIPVPYEQLALSLKQGNTELLSAALADLFERIREQPALGYEYVITVAIRITSSFLGVVHELGYRQEEVFPDGCNPYSDLLGKRSIADVQRAIETVSATIAAFFNGKKSHKNAKTILKAKEYIESHYRNSELTLRLVSEQFHTSYTYFSHLFKQLTNESFSDYLNRVRVGKAKELLESSDLRVFEVAFEVGFKDPHYFSQSFKAIYGLSPTEYKRKHSNRESGRP